MLGKRKKLGDCEEQPSLKRACTKLIESNETSNKENEHHQTQTIGKRKRPDDLDNEQEHPRKRMCTGDDQNELTSPAPSSPPPCVTPTQTNDYYTEINSVLKEAHFYARRMRNND